MATNPNFSAEEWSILRAAPQLVSMAVAGAGGGVFGAIKEAMSASQAMVESAQSRSAVVNALCSPEEIQAGQAEMQKLIMADPRNGTPERLQELAVSMCANAAAILGNRSASDLSAYSDLVMRVGETVANAAKEGGFLGFGGEVVSEGERNVMAAVAAALQGRGGSGGLGGISLPDRPTILQGPQMPRQTAPVEPSIPSQPARPAQPSAPSRSAGLPGLRPKTAQPTEVEEAPAPSPRKPASPAKPATPAKPKTTTKGGFKTGSGLKKSK